MPKFNITYSVDADTLMFALAEFHTAFDEAGVKPKSVHIYEEEEW